MKKIHKRKFEFTKDIDKAENEKKHRLHDWALTAHERYISCPECNGNLSLVHKGCNGNKYICVDCKADIFLPVNKYEPLITRKGA